MRAALFAFTERGKATALKIRAALPEYEALLRAPAKLSDESFEAYAGSLSDAAGAVFDRDALIFVGAVGIAVRAVAPHVASKRSDPAVVCLDERGQFAIPLLSGHIGGANKLARRLAEALGAVPVITTATDVNGRFSVDTWATEHGMAITSMALAKQVSAEILTRDIPFWSDAPRPGHLAEGLVWSDAGTLGVCASVRDLHPFERTLLLVPRALHVGLGCRRGVAKECVAAAVAQVFRENGLRLEAVAGAASIDVKSDEPGLLDFCRDMGWPIRFHSAEALNRVPGSFSKSEFVQKTVGTDNVCERSALIGGGRLIVPKTAQNGVTVAIAETKWGIDFG